MQAKKILQIVGGGIALAAIGVVAVLGYQYLEDQHAGLVGQRRDAFVKAATQHCSDSELGASPQVLAGYCECYADGLADTLSYNDVIAIGTLDPRVSLPMQPKLDAMAKACADHLREAGRF